MILHDRYNNTVMGRKTDFCGVVSIHLHPHIIVANWMTMFLLVRSVFVP